MAYNPEIPVDLDPMRRPGVPREREPQPEPGARWPIPQQRSRVKVFRHGRRPKTMPPVYGTAQPPHGLSGLLRAFAYRYPDHVPRHWIALMFADRVNVLESRAKKLLRLAFALGGSFTLLRAGKRYLRGC